jgi:glycosyltransferase involved in cell wall biosynthesis
VDGGQRMTTESGTAATPNGRDMSRAIAVIVPCRGHSLEVEACLASLAAQRFDEPYDIVLVDSAGDPAVARVAARHPEVRLVRSEVALPPGLARNLGSKATAAPLLAFLDADCTADPGWLAAAHAALAAGADGVGGPVGDLHPWHPVAVADNMMQFCDLHERHPAGPISYQPACNLAVRQDVFEAVHRFPPGMTNEDVLLTRRISARGADRLRFVPAMRVKHQGRRSLDGFWRHQLVLGRARGTYAFLNGPLDDRLSRFYWWLPIRALRKLAFMAIRSARFGPRAFARFLAVLPLLLPGVLVWSYGLVQATRHRLADPAATPLCSFNPTKAPNETEPTP